jgi:2-polyprenyl-3-methyl-5-hydroxy-6-metoxy-1,4-benzoquinol methylase
MLYSPQYQQVLQREHADHNWGVTGVHYAELAQQLCQQHQVDQLLDYGCGQGLLGQTMLDRGIQVTQYDPGLVEYAAWPDPHDIVFCCDVLEHVEPDCVDAVLQDLKRVCRVTGFFTVATTPAGRRLSDGRNAHLTVEPIEWWVEQISQYFDIQQQQGVEFLVTPHR